MAAALSTPRGYPVASLAYIALTSSWDTCVCTLTRKTSWQALNSLVCEGSTMPPLDVYVDPLDGGRPYVVRPPLRRRDRLVNALISRTVNRGFREGTEAATHTLPQPGGAMGIKEATTQPRFILYAQPVYLLAFCFVATKEVARGASIRAVSSADLPALR
jgi:hypothetical protein